MMYPIDDRQKSIFRCEGAFIITEISHEFEDGQYRIANCIPVVFEDIYLRRRKVRDFISDVGTVEVETGLQK